MSSRKEYSSEIGIPESVKTSFERNLLNIEGPQGTTSRIFAHPRIIISLESNKIMLKTLGNVSKREKKMLNTFEAHIQNMVDGVVKSYNYKLKICSGHFPMTVSIDKDHLLIKNFLGEKIPRKAKIIKNVKVTVNGDIINVSSVDKELAGKMSSIIEQSTRITNKDRRRFMDGIWMIEKGVQNG